MYEREKNESKKNHIKYANHVFADSIDSGTGKSTHARLWRETFGDRAVMVNDDKPLLRITKDGVIAYGTPWEQAQTEFQYIRAAKGYLYLRKGGKESYH